MTSKRLNSVEERGPDPVGGCGAVLRPDVGPVGLEKVVRLLWHSGQRGGRAAGRPPFPDCHGPDVPE